MEDRTNEGVGAAWFLPAAEGLGEPPDRPRTAQVRDYDPPEPDDGTPPNVIIAVSLDELDDMTGDMLV
jgi:hypothetical protein